MLAAPRGWHTKSPLRVSCVGQTGRCANGRLRKHSHNLKTGERCHLPGQCSKWDLDKSKSQKAHELSEGYIIRKRGTQYASDASIAPYDAVIRFFYEFLRMRYKACIPRPSACLDAIKMTYIFFFFSYFSNLFVSVACVFFLALPCVRCFVAPCFITFTN